MGITLCIRSHGRHGGLYPSSGIPKGLTVSCGGIDLSEEGVGFGVPVLKQPRETIFPGSSRVTCTIQETTVVAVEYDMNLVERLSTQKRCSLAHVALNAVREPLALLHRRYPIVRNAFSAISRALHAALGIRTTFELIESFGIVRVTYTIDTSTGNVRVHMDARDLSTRGCIELILMNEQGANVFDRYSDSEGRELKGSAIETWQEVAAGEATFLDSRHGVFFTMKSARGARLFRGRELAEGRLAWAGLAYSLPADTNNFHYDISVGTLRS